MEQISVTQINNGWVVGYQVARPQPIQTPDSKLQIQLTKVPVAQYCKDAKAVSDFIGELCAKSEQPMTMPQTVSE